MKPEDFMSSKEAALEHLLMEENAATSLGSHYEEHGEKVWSESWPRGIGANIFNDYDANSLTAAKKSSMRHDYENKFLKYDPRANMSEMIVKSYNSDPKVAPKNRIKKDSRINLKDAQIGTLTIRISGISKAIYRLTKLQQFYIGNSSITSDEVCAKFYNADFYSNQSKMKLMNSSQYATAMAQFIRRRLFDPQGASILAMQWVFI